MNKLARKTVKYSLIFLVLLVVALFAAPFFIDANHYKGIIIEKAEQTTGRKVDIGEIHASFFPWVGVRVDDVHMANRQGFSNEDFLQVKSLDVRLALLPLLSKQIEIKRFVLDSPKLLLERDASGAGNWEDLLPAAKNPAEKKNALSGAADGSQKPTASGGGASLIALSAKSLRMMNGALHYRDMQSGHEINVSELGIEVNGVRMDQPVHAQVSGRLSGDAFSVKAEVGPVGDISRLNAERLPLQADIKAKSIALKKIAAFIPALSGLGASTLAVDARIEQRRDGLRVSAGTLALHGKHEGDMAWKIEMPKQDEIKLDHVVIRVAGEKAAEIAGFVRGIGHQLQYQVRVHTPTLSRGQLSAWIPDLQVLYAAHPAPWEQVKLGLLAVGDTGHVELRDLQLMLDKELVQASGDVQFGAEPIVQLRIASRNLHVDPLLPQPEKDKSQSSMSANDESDVDMIPNAYAEDARIGQQQTANGNVDTTGARIGQSEPTHAPINTESGKEPDLRFLKSWRVTAGVQVDHLFLHGLDLAHLHATLSGKHGIFNVDPLRFELSGGQVSEKARLVVNRYPARWTESVKVRGVQVQPVLKALAGTDMVAGIMQLDTKLGGVGLLPEAAVQRLNGTGHVLLRDGMVKGFDIAGTLRNVTTLGQQGGPKQTDFSQLSGSFKVKNGVAKNDDLFMASPLFRLTGYGQVNLVAKNMDYHVKPRLVGSLAGQGDTEAARKGLSIPLRIVGSLAAPKVKLEVNLQTLIGDKAAIKSVIKNRKAIFKNLLHGGNKSVATPQNQPPSQPASQQPDKPVDQIRQQLKGLIPRF